MKLVTLFAAALALPAGGLVAHAQAPAAGTVATTARSSSISTTRSVETHPKKKVRHVRHRVVKKRVAPAAQGQAGPPPGSVTTRTTSTTVSR